MTRNPTKHTSMQKLIGDDESQTETEILTALPCPCVSLYLLLYSHNHGNRAPIFESPPFRSEQCERGIVEVASWSEQ